VRKAYYFLDYVQDANQEPYEEIQKAGFILIFRHLKPDSAESPTGLVANILDVWILVSVAGNNSLPHIHLEPFLV
jgi:hypothetical protein